MRRLIFALALSLAVAAPAVSPGLGSSAAAQTDADRARARAAYTEGQRLFDAGDFTGALAKFEEAYTIVNNPVVLLGVASAQERLGRTAEARATLERYLRERPNAPDRADIEGRIAAMPAPPTTAATPGTLSITSDPPGASVVVDGESSGAVTPTEVTLPAGAHEVALALSGYELATRSVTMTDGARSEVAVTLTAIPEAEPMDESEAFPEETVEEEPAPATSSGPSAATWVTTAIAGVALVTGTVFGFLALSRQSDFDVMPSHALADEGGAFALAADLAFGVAVAAGITAIVLYATDRPSAPAEAETETEGDADETTEAAEASASLIVAPIVSPTGGGVAAAIAF